MGAQEEGMMITIKKANKIIQESFAGSGLFVVGSVRGDELSNGTLREPAQLDDEQLFRAQCCALIAVMTGHER